MSGCGHPNCVREGFLPPMDVGEREVEAARQSGADPGAKAHRKVSRREWAGRRNHLNPESLAAGTHDRHWQGLEQEGFKDRCDNTYEDDELDSGHPLQVGAVVHSQDI